MKILESSLIKDRLADPSLRVVDCRFPVRYLQGHIPGAVNLPGLKVFDEKNAVLPEEQLSQIFGRAGIDLNAEVVLYDSYDGQNAAMLAWTLEYLGHPNVQLLSTFFEWWASEGNEVLYKPVKPEPRNFGGKPNKSIRAVLQDIAGSKDDKLLDLRSEEEFRGRTTTEPRAGHLPSAINLPWTLLLGANNKFLRPKQELEKVMANVGLNPEDRIVTYCSSGPRAALGYIALQQLDYRNARVYDASFHEWAQLPELPVEA